MPNQKQCDKTQIDRLTMLVDFGRQIAQESHLEPLLNLIAEKVREILGADRCSLFIYDEKKKELWSQIAHGLEGQTIRVPLGKGIVGQVGEKMAVINITDAYQDDRFNKEVDIKSGYHTKTILALPMKNRDGILLGVFQVLNKQEGVFSEEDIGLLMMLGTLAASAIENAQLYDEIRKSHFETIMRLATAAESRDQVDLAGHLQRMSHYAALIAKAMGWPADKVEAIQYASPLHDIGKIAIPDAVLKKPGKLLGDELIEMHEHPARGAKILEKAESELLKMAYNICYSHHEQFDGSGYPKGLKGEEIPIEARIVSLADVFDALVSKRVYKSGWSLEETLEYIRKQAGTQFDPQVVDAFFSCLPEIKAELAKLSEAPKEP